MKKIVGVLSPYAGDIDNNIALARMHCRAEVDQGNIPFAPHLYFPRFMSEATEREEAISMGIQIMSRCCDEIHVYGAPTVGMQYEIDVLEGIKPIKYFEVSG